MSQNAAPVLTSGPYRISSYLLDGTLLSDFHKETLSSGSGLVRIPVR